jgi:hypothetical protein
LRTFGGCTVSPRQVTQDRDGAATCVGCYAIIFHHIDSLSETRRFLQTSCKVRRYRCAGAAADAVASMMRR